jgi:Ulp1 family protease
MSLATNDNEMRELSEWLDSGDRYSLGVARYLKDEAANNTKAGHRTPDCKLPATDFLRLREGEWINDNLLDAALNSICEL